MIRCSWSADDETPHHHIPLQCGRNAAVIYVGPRPWQYDPICKGHVQAYETPRKRDKNPWKKLTPEEFEVHRVMSE